MKSPAVIAAALLLAASTARAQTRPLQTEEAATARQGTIVFETGVDLMRNEPNFITGEERTRFDGPLLRLVWSPADTVEIDLEWVAKVAAFDDPTFGDVSDWGDVTLRAKTRFVDESTHGYGLSARFNVTLPETNFGNGLGPNALRMSAQMLLSKCGRVCVHANAGLGEAEQHYRGLLALALKNENVEHALQVAAGLARLQAMKPDFDIEFWSWVDEGARAAKAQNMLGGDRLAITADSEATDDWQELVSRIEHVQHTGAAGG